MIWRGSELRGHLSHPTVPGVCTPRSTMIQPLFRAMASALLVFLLLAWPSVHAWEATTRLTNVPIADEDVASIISRALEPTFDATFPPARYSILVHVDAIEMRNGQQVVYLSVGLARRLSGGQHLQQHANISAALLRPTSEPREARREAVIQALSELIATFSKVMEDNADRVR
jgi:hypothetical protein